MKRYIKTFESFKYDMLKQERLNESKSSKSRRLYENKGGGNTIIQGLFALVKAGAIKDYKSMMNLVLNMTGKEFKELFGTDNPTSLLINILKNCKIPYQTYDKMDILVYLPKLNNENIQGDYYIDKDISKGGISFLPFGFKNDIIKDDELVSKYYIPVAETSGTMVDVQKIHPRSSQVMNLGEYIEKSPLNNLFQEYGQEKIFQPLASALKSKQISPELKKQLPDMIAKLSDKTKGMLTLNDNVKKELGIESTDIAKNIKESRLLRSSRYRRLYEAEEALKPALSPIVYLLSAIPFKSFKEFKEFLFSLNGADFKKLYGKDSNPTQLLSDMLSWGGVQVYPNKLDSNSMGLFAKQKPGTSIRLSEQPFIPFIKVTGKPIGDSEMVKDYLVDVLKTDGINDYSTNWDSMVSYTLEEYLNKDWNEQFYKKGDETYKSAVKNLVSKKPDVKELEKLGLRINSFTDLMEVINGLSKPPKEKLASFGLVSPGDGDKVSYSPEAKKAANQRFNNQIKDSTSVGSPEPNKG